MTFPKLLLLIGLAIVGFWVFGFVFAIAAWIIDLALFVGLVLIILFLIDIWWQGRKGKNNR